MKKAQAASYIMFFFAALIVITIAAVLAPAGARFTTVMYQEGEEILADAQPDIDSIQDATVRSHINQSFTNAKDAAQQNIDVNTAIFQYSWVLVILVTGITYFLYTRRTIEFGGGFV